MTDYEMVRSMVLNFRLSELQTFMAYAGQGRHGRKSELQNRALELIKGNPRDLASKVKELSNAMYKSIGSATSVNPYSPNYVPDSNVTMRETRSRSSLSQTSTTSSTTATSTTSSTTASKSSSTNTSHSSSSNSASSSASSASGTPTGTSSLASASKSISSSGYSSSQSSSASPASDFIPLILNGGVGGGSGSGVTNPFQSYHPYSAYNNIHHSDKSVFHQEKPASSHLMYPPCTDVKLRRLPFFDVEAVLLKPSSLQPKGNARFQEQNFSFNLTPGQASGINASAYRDEFGRTEYKKQIQLRFSLMETSCEQDDNFPQNICVKVNGRLQPLPNPIPTNKQGVEPKRPPKPLNITSICRISPLHTNYINVSWGVEPGRGYTISVYYVDKLTSHDLLKRLKNKGMRNSDYTRAVIKDKLNDTDSEIATTSCKVSLACPLGKMRMILPCRASTCDHLQCFDASLYLKMNEKKAKWLCPVCNKPALYDNLLLDGFFSEVLMSPRLPRDEHEIVLQQDSSWDPIVPKKDSLGASTSRVTSSESTSHSKVETFNVDDDDCEPTAVPSTSSGASRTTAISSADKTVDCITLDSDSEEEEIVAPPSSKRPRLTAFLDDDDSSTSSVLSTSHTPSASPPPRPLSDAMPPPAPPRPLPTPPAAAPIPTSSSPPLICIDDDDD